jgi:hypothetical protein
MFRDFPDHIEKNSLISCFHMVKILPFMNHSTIRSNDTAIIFGGGGDNLVRISDGCNPVPSRR